MIRIRVLTVLLALTWSAALSPVYGQCIFPRDRNAVRGKVLACTSAGEWYRKEVDTQVQIGKKHGLEVPISEIRPKFKNAVVIALGSIHIRHFMLHCAEPEKNHLPEAFEWTDEWKDAPASNRDAQYLWAVGKCPPLGDEITMYQAFDGTCCDNIAPWLDPDCAFDIRKIETYFQPDYD